MIHRPARSVHPFRLLLLLLALLAGAPLANAAPVVETCNEGNAGSTICTALGTCTDEITDADGNVVSTTHYTCCATTLFCPPCYSDIPVGDLNTENYEYLGNQAVVDVDPNQTGPTGQSNAQGPVHVLPDTWSGLTLDPTNSNPFLGADNTLTGSNSSTISVRKPADPLPPYCNPNNICTCGPMQTVDADACCYEPPCGSSARPWQSTDSESDCFECGTRKSWQCGNFNADCYCCGAPPRPNPPQHCDIPVCGDPELPWQYTAPSGKCYGCGAPPLPNPTPPCPVPPEPDVCGDPALPFQCTNPADPCYSCDPCGSATNPWQHVSAYPSTQCPAACDQQMPDGTTPFVTPSPYCPQGDPCGSATNPWQHVDQHPSTSCPAACDQTMPDGTIPFVTPSANCPQLPIEPDCGSPDKPWVHIDEDPFTDCPADCDEVMDDGTTPFPTEPGSTLCPYPPAPSCDDITCYTYDSPGVAGTRIDHCEIDATCGWVGSLAQGQTWQCDEAPIPTSCCLVEVNYSWSTGSVGEGNNYTATAQVMAGTDCQDPTVNCVSPTPDGGYPAGYFWRVLTQSNYCAQNQAGLCVELHDGETRRCTYVTIDTTELNDNCRCTDSVPCGDGEPIDPNDTVVQNDNPGAACYVACDALADDGTIPFPTQSDDPSAACYCGSPSAPWEHIEDNPATACPAACDEVMSDNTIPFPSQSDDESAVCHVSPCELANDTVCHITGHDLYLNPNYENPYDYITSCESTTECVEQTGGKEGDATVTVCASRPTPDACCPFEIVHHLNLGQTGSGIGEITQTHWNVPGADCGTLPNTCLAVPAGATWQVTNPDFGDPGNTLPLVFECIAEDGLPEQDLNTTAMLIDPAIGGGENV